LWNPEPDAQELLVTLKYGDGQFYKLPVTLESHASTMIDIGELMRTRQLDQDGNLLPPDAKQGSLVVSSPANEPEDAIDVVLGIGIYNPTKATCGVECGTCNGIIDSFMDPASWLYSVGAGQQLRSGYYDNLGYQYDITNSSSWSSSASQVIGVQTSGQQTPGMSTAVSVGSAQLTAAYWLYVPYFYVQACLYDDPLPCPSGPVQSQGSGKVQVPGSVGALSAGNPYCDEGRPFGIKISIVYQLYDQSNPPQVMAVAGMIPGETDTWSNGSQTGPTPLASNPTTAQGQFLDSPVGACSAVQSDFPIKLTQKIQMQAPGANPPNGPCTDPTKLSGVIRTNNWTISVPAGSAGEITNGADVDVKRN
jgi:hypothetical protein